MMGIEDKQNKLYQLLYGILIIVTMFLLSGSNDVVSEDMNPLAEGNKMYARRASIFFPG